MEGMYPLGVPMAGGYLWELLVGSCLRLLSNRKLKNSISHGMKVCDRIKNLCVKEIRLAKTLGHSKVRSF